MFEFLREFLFKESSMNAEAQSNQVPVWTIVPTPEEFNEIKDRLEALEERFDQLDGYLAWTSKRKQYGITVKGLEEVLKQTGSKLTTCADVEAVVACINSILLTANAEVSTYINGAYQQTTETNEEFRGVIS
jgi:hypothetical protein